MDAAVLRSLIAGELESLRAIRRDLHAHPELGYQERRTSQVVMRELSRLGIAHVGGLAGGTGVLAHLPATGTPTNRTNGTDTTHTSHASHQSYEQGAQPSATTRAIALRADMDALPILEETGVPYASTTPGIMHACGHDGHTTILLGAARVLSKLPRPRPVTLIFQPAEEGGAGGDRLCKEGVLDGTVLGPPVEKIFGLHGWPEAPLGHIWTRPGPLLASTDEIRVTIHGVQSHGAYPHYSRDTIVAAAQCIVALQTVVSRNTSPLEACVVTIGKIEGGTATNIIPQSVTFIGTIRALTAAVRETARKRVREIIEGVASAMGCSAEVHIGEGYPVTHNDPVLTERFFAMARGAIGAERVGVNPAPTMGGEDFSFYAQRVPGVFFCLGLKPPGQAKCPTLHQPDFDFNDEATPTGVEMMCRCAVEG